MEDVVVLVPGFLGFSRFGGFYYFAERLISVLRGSLEQPEGGALPVVPVSTLPTNSLAERQERLLEELHGLQARLGRVGSFHLIGHSTGGVDAQLLACSLTADGHPWPARWDDIRSRIRTVITISAPHFGTELADSRVALIGKDPLGNPQALLEQLRVLAGLARLIPSYVRARAGFNALVPNELLKFAWQVVQNRDLIDDLRVENMEDRRRILHHDENVRLVCFVTGVEPRADFVRPTEPLYADLYALTAGGTAVSPEVQECADVLQAYVTTHPQIVIANPRAIPPTISPQLNDGVVNSVRQIVRPEEKEIGGFVVADHADALGSYDRQDGLIDGRSYDAGLFHSGAGFEDIEFYKLYWRIAEVILGARDRRREEVDRLRARRPRTGPPRSTEPGGGTVGWLRPILRGPGPHGVEARGVGRKKKSGRPRRSPHGLR